MKSNPRVIVMGGGTGMHNVLLGLKQYDLDISAVVAMTDSGGSSGRLRDQLGVLPPGDLRQCLVALSESPEVWRKLFTYRFGSGELGGHSFGNLFLTALEGINGSFRKGIEQASSLLNIKGRVVPVTYSDCTLCAKYEDGSVIEGESDIDRALTKRPRIDYMYLTPEAKLNPDAKKVIEKADFIIFGPGDLYTSIIPNLLVNNISGSIAESKAKKIYVVNLMTKKGQTDSFGVSDHIYEIEKYLGESFLDYVLINIKRPEEKLLSWYEEHDNVVLVEDDLGERYVTEAQIFRGDLLSNVVYEQNVADRLKRSLIRHDPEKLAKMLMSIIDKAKS